MRYRFLHVIVRRAYLRLTCFVVHTTAADKEGLQCSGHLNVFRIIGIYVYIFKAVEFSAQAYIPRFGGVGVPPDFDFFYLWNNADKRQYALAERFEYFVFLFFRNVVAKAEQYYVFYHNCFVEYVLFCEISHYCAIIKTKHLSVGSKSVSL